METAYLYGLPLHEVTRPFLFGFQMKPSIVFPALLIVLIALAICNSWINLFYRKKIWLNGSANSTTKPKFSNLLTHYFFASPPGKKVLFRISHSLLFYAIVIYLITGLIYLANILIAIPIFSYNLIFGYQYLIWTFFTDSAGVLVITALIIDLFLRYIVKPQNLVTDTRHIIFHLLLIVTLFSGYAAEAIRIALSDFPGFEKWSFIGYLSALLFSPLPASILENLYTGSIILYTATIVTLIARFGTPYRYGNLFPFYNIATTDFTQLSTAKKNLFSNNTEFSEPETYFGVNKVTELPFQSMKACDSCTECGACDDYCPAVLSETTLSPKNIVVTIKNQINALDFGKEEACFIPSLISPQALFSCLDCGACNEVCPSIVQPLSVITELKKYVTSESKSIPEHISQLYRNIEYNNSVYQKTKKKNAYILESGLACDVRSSTDYDYLLFAGCYYGSLEKGRSTVLNFLKLCNKAGIKIGILGEDEGCCGDIALRSGNNHLFYSCASYNLNQFRKYGITKIITMCPHGYNTIKKEYKKVSQILKKSNEYIKVLHYTDIILSIIEDQNIPFQKQLNKRIVYHDSCYLGRFNNYYMPPREILNTLPGTDLREMSRHGQLAVCCGSSGAAVELKKRIAYKLGEFRAMDSVTAGADIIATSCPFCETSIREGLRDIQQDKIEVMNIADIVALYSN